MKTAELSERHLNLRSFCKAIFFSSVALLLLPQISVASPANLTYQGRILTPNGQGLEYGAVSFDFSILSADGNCVIYRELRNGVDMRNSKGVFDTPIGTGSRTYPTSPGYSLLEAFDNSKTHLCDGGVTYSPAFDDVRRLRVQFYDGVGWKLITPDSIIRSVPFAGFAWNSSKLSGKVLNDFVMKDSLPAACAVGQVITFNGTSFSCVTDQGGAGVVSSVVGSGPIAVTGTGNLTVSATVGTTAGTLAAGDDSRFTNSRTPSGAAGGDLTGSYPGPTIAANAVTTTKIIDGAVTTNKIPDGAITSAKILDNTISVSDLALGSAAGQVFRYSGAAWQISKLNYQDLVNSSGVSPWPGSCGAGQYITWVSVADGFACVNVSFNSSAVTTALGYTPVNPTRVISTGTAATTGLLGGGDLSADRNLSVNVGTGANQIPQLDGSGKLNSSVLPTSVTNGLWTESSGNVHRSTGRVGIGTSSPGGELEVRGLDADGNGGYGGGSSNPATNIRVVTSNAQAAGVGGSIGLGGENGVAQNLFAVIQSRKANSTSGNGDGELQLRTYKSGVGWNTGLLLDEDGNVGLGTLTPTNKLEVVGNIKGTQLCIGADCRSAWPGSGGGGTVTQVNAGTGLTGGPITGSGTLAVDVGTTANKIVQLDGSGNLPALNGSALTGLNASNISSGTLNAARLPALSSSNLSDSSDLLKVSSMPANCGANQTLTFSSPSGTWVCSSIAITGSAFGSQSAGLVLASPTGASGNPTFRALASTDLPSSITNGLWTESSGNVYRSTGNVGIGTSTPGQKLSVAGTIESTLGGIKFPDGTTQVTAATMGTQSQVWFYVKDDTYAAPSDSVIALGKTYTTGSAAFNPFVQQGGHVPGTNGFSLTTGEFKPPVAGRYYFHAQASASVTNALLEIYKNGATIGNGMMYTATGSPGWTSGHVTVVVDLLTTDKVTFAVVATNGLTISQTYNYQISGYMLPSQNVVDAKYVAGTVADANKVLKVSSDGQTITASEIQEVSGNVGIGTTSPGAVFHVSKALNQTSVDGISQLLQLENTAAPATGQLAGIRFRQSDGTSAAQGFLGLSNNNAGVNGRANFVIASPNTSGNAIPRVTIDTAGNVGIGTSSPGQKLSVAGTIESTSGGIKFPNGSTQVGATGNVNLRYYGGVSTSVPSGTFTTIVFNVKEYDSHNAFNGSTFVVPESGIYSIMAAANSSINGFEMDVFVNGNRAHAFLATSLGVGTGSTMMNLVAGQSITIQMHQGSGSTATVGANSLWTWLAITKIGN